MNVMNVKRANTMDSSKQNHEKQIEDVDKNISYTSKFVLTPYWYINTLTKINFNVTKGRSIDKPHI